MIAPQSLDAEATSPRSSRGCASPRERRADLRAQLAANVVGARAPRELASAARAAALAEQRVESVLDYGERRRRAPRGARRRRATRRATSSRPPRATSSCACVRPVAGDAIVLDFTGSAAQHAGNLNCPLAVTRSACYFAVRVLTDPDTAAQRRRDRADRGARPPGLAAQRAPRRAAVAAGNVETSSRVADLVLAAFGRALGQGTMNNLTLGNERFSYYETIGGGQGACPRRRRPERRARRDEQHAQHAGRGARARLPAARRRATSSGADRAAPGASAAATA